MRFVSTIRRLGSFTIELVGAGLDEEKPWREHYHIASRDVNGHPRLSSSMSVLL